MYNRDGHENIDIDSCTKYHMKNTILLNIDVGKKISISTCSQNTTLNKNHVKYSDFFAINISKVEYKTYPSLAYTVSSMCAWECDHACACVCVFVAACLSICVQQVPQETDRLFACGFHCSRCRFLGCRS